MVNNKSLKPKDLINTILHNAAKQISTSDPQSLMPIYLSFGQHIG
jgi:hypothetical protein